MERQALLEPAALSRRSGRRTDPSRWELRAQHIGIAILAGQTRAAPGHANVHRAESESTGRDGKPGWGQRQLGVPRIELVNYAQRTSDRAREVVRGRPDLLRLPKTQRRHASTDRG